MVKNFICKENFLDFFFSCGATLYSLLCVCVFVCLFSVFAMKYLSKKLVLLESVQCLK